MDKHTGGGGGCSISALGNIPGSPASPPKEQKEPKTSLSGGQLRGLGLWRPRERAEVRFSGRERASKDHKSRVLETIIPQAHLKQALGKVSHSGA